MTFIFLLLCCQESPVIFLAFIKNQPQILLICKIRGWGCLVIVLFANAFHVVACLSTESGDGLDIQMLSSIIIIFLMVCFAHQGLVPETVSIILPSFIEIKYRNPKKSLAIRELLIIDIPTNGVVFLR